MKTTALLYLSVLFSAMSPCFAATAQTLSPNESLNELKSGNERFTSSSGKACSDTKVTVSRLATGQAPNAIVLSCSDSRVPPEIVFDQKPGQIFAVRVAGNILNPDAIASMEYAVAKLGSRLIVILGHESCGAVKAALETGPTESAGSPSLDHLIGEIRTNLGTIQKTSDPDLKAPVTKNVNAVATELMKRSEIIRDAVKTGKVQIQRGIYDIHSGRVEFLN